MGRNIQKCNYAYLYFSEGLIPKLGIQNKIPSCYFHILTPSYYEKWAEFQALFTHFTAAKNPSFAIHWVFIQQGAAVNQGTSHQVYLCNTQTSVCHIILHSRTLNISGVYLKVCNVCCLKRNLHSVRWVVFNLKVGIKHNDGTNTSTTK